MNILVEAVANKSSIPYAGFGIRTFSDPQTTTMPEFSVSKKNYLVRQKLPGEAKTHNSAFRPSAAMAGKEIPNDMSDIQKLMKCNTKIRPQKAGLIHKNNYMMMKLALTSLIMLRLFEAVMADQKRRSISFSNFRIKKQN